MKKLILFDLDGTLLDTFKDIYAALQYVFESHNFPTPTIETAKIFISDGLKTSLSPTVNSSHIDEMPQYLRDEFRAYYRKNVVVHTKPFPHMFELVDKLHADGNKLAILSNKPEFMVKAIIEHFGITNKFDYLAGGDSFIEKKPSPLPILTIAKSLGFETDLQNVIMIGDSDNDTLSANAAGVRSIFCSFGYGTNLKSPATYSINSADEIYSLI